MGTKYQNKYLSPVQGGATQGVNRAGAEWSGKTLVTSAAANLFVISCTVVASTSAIYITPQMFGAESASAFNGFCVRTVNPGVGFIIGTVNSIGPLVSSYAFMWQVQKLA